MKKRILFTVILTLLLSALLGIGSFAAQHGTLALSSSGAVKAGETVTLSVKLTGATDIDGIAVTPTYDEKLFELTGGTWKISGVMTDFSLTTKDGVIAFSEGTAINTTILTFTLKVKSTVEAGNYSVGCSAVVSSVDGAKSTLTATAQVKVTCTHSFTVKNTDAKYQKSAATCSSAAVYYYSCAKCGEKGSTTFKSGSALPHTFNQKNTADQYIHTAGSCTKAAVYYYSCKCGEMGSDTFVGADPAHRYAETLVTDKDNHWYECSVCGDRKEQAAHTPGPEATEESAQVCTVCGYEIAPAIVHQHDFTAHWYGDDATHWGKCRCGEESEPIVHTYGEGTVVSEPTATQQGVILYTCADCGRMKVEYTDPDPSQNQPSKPADTESPDKPLPKPSDKPSDDPADEVDNEDGSFGMGALVGALGGLLIGGAAVFVTLSKGKKAN